MTTAIQIIHGERSCTVTSCSAAPRGRRARTPRNPAPGTCLRCSAQIQPRLAMVPVHFPGGVCLQPERLADSSRGQGRHRRTPPTEPYLQTTNRPRRGRTTVPGRSATPAGSKWSRGKSYPVAASPGAPGDLPPAIIEQAFSLHERLQEAPLRLAYLLLVQEPIDQLFRLAFFFTPYMNAYLHEVAHRFAHGAKCRPVLRRSVVDPQAIVVRLVVRTLLVRP